MSALVECVPNFSEGRRPDVINAIRDAMAATGAHILDVSSDLDHNRTVITMAGAPDVLVDAAFEGIRVAAVHIDLREHQGVHPRIGAADVVPFIPLRDISLEECAELARSLGERVGRELSLPVFLYEAAATDPSRTNLADIRRGGYERLAERMNAAEDALQPDYGPLEVSTAGGLVIGARGPLVAYNAYLDTDDVSVAKAIARAVRESSGGLPYIKALGLLVDGRAQVSMNVIDFRRTALYTVTEAVRREAMARGVSVTETELVGLVPRRALIDAAVAYLGLPPNVRHQTIEERLGQRTGDYQEIVFE